MMKYNILNMLAILLKKMFMKIQTIIRILEMDFKTLFVKKDIIMIKKQIHRTVFHVEQVVNIVNQVNYVKNAITQLI